MSVMRFSLAILGVSAFVLVGTAAAAKKPNPANAEPAPAIDANADESADDATPVKPSAIDPAALESDKELAKFVKTLRKQFKKEDGYYVLRLIESGMEEDKAKAQTAKDSNVAYKPYSNVTFETLNGREAAIARLVEFLGEHNPPWRKRPSSKSANAEPRPQTPPPPRRDWRPVNWFPQTADGQRLAQAARTRAEQAHQAEVKAAEDRNKPKCACQKQAAAEAPAPNPTASPR